MIVHDCKQGEREWWALRLGMPTASNFSRIVTPSTLVYSAGARAFACELILERMIGEPSDQNEVGTIWTKRGNEQEAKARLWYEAHRDCDITQVGFITTDGGKIGCSPDGLVGDVGGLEIKCFGAKHHLEVVLGIDKQPWWLQVQGSLWITGRAWWDVVNFNEKLPKRIQRIYPDPTTHEKLEEHLDTFLGEIEMAEQQLAECGDVIEDDGLLTALIASVKGKV